MTNTPFSLPVPGGAISFTENGIVFTPNGGNPIALPATVQNLPQQFTLPNLLLPSLPAGGLPDLSALLPVLTPILSAVVPGIAPLLGALLQILHALSTQLHASASSGTPNPALQLVHDAAWQQVLAAFGQKQSAPAAPAA